MDEGSRSVSPGSMHQGRTFHKKGLAMKRKSDRRGSKSPYGNSGCPEREGKKNAAEMYEAILPRPREKRFHKVGTS